MHFITSGSWNKSNHKECKVFHSNAWSCRERIDIVSCITLCFSLDLLLPITYLALKFILQQILLLYIQNLLVCFVCHQHCQTVRQTHPTIHQDQDKWWIYNAPLGCSVWQYQCSQCSVCFSKLYLLLVYHRCNSWYTTCALIRVSDMWYKSYWRQGWPGPWQRDNILSLDYKLTR